jgi:hypothetical protein
MNCDYVFDILTRGPFPSGGADDAAVERHLAACHGCRELAEALRPAVELLHESVSGDEGDSLPGYRGALRPETARLDLWTSVAVAAESSDEHSVEARSSQGASPSRQKRTTLVGYATAALAGVLLATLIGLAGWPWNHDAASLPASRHGAATVMAAPYQPDAEGLRTLVALNLSEVCFPRNVVLHDRAGIASSTSTSSAGTADGITHEAVLCCTECHYSGSAHRPPPEAVATVQMQCHVCHRP